MDELMKVILDFLNDLIPSGEVETQFATLNELLAYGITLLLIWGVIFRPLLKAVRVIK